MQAVETFEGDRALAAEKVDQAIRLLEEFDIDAWLILGGQAEDAGLAVILGRDLAWPSALILSRGGDRIAIVGANDEITVRSTGAWSTVVPCAQSLREPLVDALRRLDPATLAVHKGSDDTGVRALARCDRPTPLEHLDGTPFGRRTIGADPIVEALRGRKSPMEIARIRDAVAITEDIFTALADRFRANMSERDVAHWFHEEAARRGVSPAWDAASCPMVSAGRTSAAGHVAPSDLLLERGRVLHVDFGVRRGGYCSDLQQCWYAPREREQGPPEGARRAFGALRSAIHAAAEALRPGVACWQVDAAARHALTRAGYPEHQHGTGHHVGRNVHDGGGVLAPRWERFGQAPFRRVDEGNVFALELGVDGVADLGSLGLEEMVLVTRHGCEFLSTPRNEVSTLDW